MSKVASDGLDETAAIGRVGWGMIKFATRRPLPIKDSAVSARAISWLAAPLLVTLSIGATAARAQDATWSPAPVSNDFNTDANWTPATTPTGTASFGLSNTTSLTLSTGTTIDTFRFNADAPAYRFNLNGPFLEFTGTGIVNNSANLHTIDAFGLLQFDNTATAGNAVINNTPGSTTFTGSSTAGTATITNSGGGLLSFTDFSTAGSATITTNAGSRTQFSTNGDGGNARFVTNGSGVVDFSNTAGPDGSNTINTGSIAGSGQYFIGYNVLHTGGNGDTTTVSGVIGWCSMKPGDCTATGGPYGGLLLKEGSGTLTLSGVNTYFGATVLDGGTLQMAGAGTLGADGLSVAQLQVLSGTLDLGGTTQVTDAMSMGGGSIVNGALNSTNYTLGGGFISASLTGAGKVTQDGFGTTTLAATNTYTGGTAINSGTLEVAHASGGTIDALSNGVIAINSGAALRSSVSGTLGNAITFNGGSFGTLSAAAGTALTLTGGVFLNADSVTTFGSPTDTGTILVNTTAITPSNSASVVVGGGILRAGSFQFGGALGTIQSTTVNAGATLDLNDFSAAIHNLGGGGSVVTGTSANTSLSLTVDPATSSEFSGVISGAGKVTVTGGGTMVLSGDNTYGNGTSIMAGTTLQLGNGGVAGSIVGNVLDGGALVFNRSNMMTFTGLISDFSGDGPASAGSLVQNGTGTTILTGNNTYTAGTRINAGTLQLGNGGTTGSIVGNVLNNGTFAINRSDAVAFGGVISGTGALQQIGTGTATLSAVQTYQGSTTISAGVLALTGSASIAASSGVAANAKFDISGLSGGTSITNLSGGSAGAVALGNNTLTLTDAAGTFAGVISGSGGLVKQGSGLFTLSGANDYTGATTVAGGNLRVNGSVAGAVTVQSGAMLSGIGSVGGLVTIQSGGTLSAGQSPGTITLGALNLDAGSTSTFELGSPGVVGGATNDLVNVIGNLTLSGTLSVNAPSAGYYRLFNYGTLTPSNFATITGSTSGTPTVLTNVPNQVNLSIAAAGQRIQFWDGADQTGNGVVNGGTGTWNASNTNWTGAPGQAGINDQWRSSVGVFAGAAGTVTIAGTQAFDTLQFSTTGYALNPGAGGQLQLSGLSGTGTINTDNGVTATINAPIVDGSSQSLTKVGGGALVLTAANTYSGGTTISAGTLQLGNGGASGSIVGNVTDNGVFAINRNDAFTFGGVVSGTGAFNQIGTGSTILTAIQTYSGLTTITAGTLALADAGSIANSSGVVANGVFDISGVSAAGTSIKSLSGAGSVALGSRTLTLTNASDNFAGSIGGNGGITLATGTQSLSTINGYTGATTITGGTLALAGAGSIANSSGVVANGVFDISGLSGAGTSITTLSGSGSVALGSRTLTLTNASGNFAGSITGGGGLTLAGGPQTLSGSNDYTGLTTITTGGTLSLSGAGNISSSSGVIANGAFNISGLSGAGTSVKTLSGTGSVLLGARTLTLTDASGNFAGVIGGGGGVMLQGGTETLSGSNTYTGATTISGGTLTVAAGGGITSNVTNAATFNNSGAVAGNVGNSGTFANNVGGTVSGQLTNTAGTTTNTGQLNGGASVTGGTLTNNNLITGAVGISGGTVNNNATITGTVANAATFNNNVNGTVSGQLTNTAGTTTNAGQLNGGAGVSGGTLTNNNLISGAVGISGGTLNNNAIITGTVSNAALFNNNAGGTVSGQLTNTDGTTTNAGQLNGGASVSGGTLTNNNLISGAVGISGGSVNNNAIITGTVANAATFNNNAGGMVSGQLTNTAGTTTNAGQLNGGANVSSGTLTNNNLITGAVGISGGTLNNNAIITGTVANAATFNNNPGGTVSGMLTNTAGTTSNAGQLNGGASVSGGTLTNNNLITGAVGISGGTVNNNAIITGTVANAGTFNNNVNGTVSGQLTNTAGTTTNAGQLNGGASVGGGTLTNNNLISGAVGISGGGVNNSAIITGTVANAAAFNNNAGGTVSGQLTNTAGTTTNAGQLNGGATVSGGTLTTTGTISGGLTSSATVNAAGVVNGPIANNAGTFTTTGTLASNSTFANAPGAALAVGAATYTLQGLLTNSGALMVAAGATLDASAGGITNTASGTISVAAGGTVKDDLNNAGIISNAGTYVANVASNTGAGSITNAATGTWTGNVLSNAATIINSGIWTGNVASNTGIITNNLTWTGTVANAGTFNNNAGATVSGLLTNTAGTTTNNGALNGGANVGGGTFTGSGTVTSLTISGGTFAPGNGTPGSSMTVSGNLALQSGAMYLVALNPATASFANVGGTASLSGTAAAVYLAGNYVSKKYTILTAAGGVSGTFGSLVNTNMPANFTSSLSYDANHAYIDLALAFVPNPAPNFGGGLTINQQNVANSLVNFFNSSGGIPLAFASLTPAGLTQASGELGTGIIQTAIKADDMFLNLLLDPSIAGRAGGFASGSPAAAQFADDDEALAYAAGRKTRAERAAYAMATTAPYLAPQPVSRWSVWGAAYGGAAKVDGNAIVGTHDLTTRVWGVVGGADYKLTPDALVGFALAGGGTNYSLSEALGTGRSELFQAGVFGRQNIGAAYLSAALAYGWHDVTTNRTVALPAGDVLQARFRAETFSGRFEGGYRFATPYAGITPYVAAQAISFSLPAYAEQVLGGAGTFALSYAGQTTTATRTELGLRSDRSFAMQDGIFTLRGRAAWAHDYNPDRAVTAVFQALPGAAFVVNGASANPDAALVSAGAEMKWLNGFSLAATFEGEFSGNTTSYAGKGVAKYSW
ncbi:MAG: fibronectin-binding autotransporter adhesin [Bradyrhizobium sp.]|nr:fibronectin-binding autotransporter adhesin [Bradyrhizobium sp.]